MRTWNASLASTDLASIDLASIGRWFAKGCFAKSRSAKKRFATTFGTLATLLLLTVGSALAQPASTEGGEAALKLPDLSTVSFLGVDGHRLLMIGIWHGDLHAPKESARPSLHARDFGTDLRNL
jgi:hypothetical protein